MVYSTSQLEPAMSDALMGVENLPQRSEHEEEVDPGTDLVPLCANCHRMAHRRRASVTPINELKALIEEANGYSGFHSY
jgi:hypothetical protein